MKNYIITGASSGVGEAFVRNIAATDVRQIIIGRNSDKLKLMSEELPGRIIPITYDLLDYEHIENVFKPCLDEDFKLDGMVYCAGLDGTWPIKANNVLRLNEIMTVNCYSFVEMSRFFYSKRYSVDGSSIVAISSIASLNPDKGMLAYSMSKAALNTVIKTASKEFVRRKIRVNGILPGGILTPMAKKKGEMLDSIVENAAAHNNPQPLGMIPVIDIAEMIEYLLSDKAAYMTGELTVMSAGRNY